jgi:hypothetical protein
MLHPAKQWKHMAAMLLIGDGVMALVRPQWDAEAWAVGPMWWKKSMRFFRDCPTLTRVIAGAQIAGGIWWALSQESEGLGSGDHEE